MAQLPGLPDGAFDKADPAPDTEFYDFPRFVTHIDDEAIGAVIEIYRTFLPVGGAVLDIMSSWISHLPPDLTYSEVVGHGMNAEELAANARLTRWFVQDLNDKPILPLPDSEFDGACLCVSVQYLQRPVDVFREIARVLRNGAPFIVSFSNRCFPTKAVAIWQRLTGPEQQRLVGAYMDAAGFTGVDGYAHTPRGSDPLWAVVGRAPSGG
jgi:SAM-dependent methyltransferase